MGPVVIRHFSWILGLWLAAVPTNADAKRKKRRKKGPPPVGWYQPNGWAHACYYPPDFAALVETERRIKRSEVLDALLQQWRGDRNDGVQFDDTVIENVETVLLGRPNRVEDIATTNLGYCETVMSEGAMADAWGSWLRALPGQLTAGECNHPLTDKIYDYLDIGTDWQGQIPLCQGDRAQIIASKNDRYRIADKGSWMNVTGDQGAPAGGTELPCNREGCFAGQLIGRFVTEDGVETIFPIGTRAVWVAPAHGEMSYRINDTTFFDNKWHRSGSLIDHTSIEIRPAE